MAVERTLSLIKPDAVRRALSGAVNHRIEGHGLKIVAQKRLRLSYEQAAAFYAVHKERSFFKDLCTYMSSGPLVAQILEGEDAVVAYRTLMGDTNPTSAAAGTLRKEFGLSIEENTVHGSDSVANAAQEMGFFFSQLEIYPA